MLICSELIEKLEDLWGYFWPGWDKFESWKIIHTFDEVMT